MLRDHGKIRPARAGIDCLLQYLADQLRAAYPQSGRNFGALAAQPRQGLGCQVEGKHALAALVQEIAADRLPHPPKADEADGLVVRHRGTYFTNERDGGRCKANASTLLLARG